jgi:magnesium-transporting ATPase (P-type)
MALDMEKDTICWLVVSWDDEILNIWKKQFQTTNQIWSWKIPYKWRFIAGNIICKWTIFHSYVKEPEGKFKAS